MTDIFETIIFTIGNYQLVLGQLLLVVVIIGLGFWLFRRMKGLLGAGALASYDVPPKQRSRLIKYLKYLILLICTLLLILTLKLNPLLIAVEGYTVRLSLLIEAVIIVQFARLLDWLISNIVIHKYYVERDEALAKKKRSFTENESNAARIVQYIVYAAAAILILRNFNLDFELYHLNFADDKSMAFKLSNIVGAVLILLVAQLIVWLITQIILYSVYRRNDIEVGAQFAINQLLKYLIYVIAFIMALSKLGIDMTLILGGAAALLVGIGLGLQQTFNDFFSGIVLLFERSVSIGDIVEIEGEVGSVQRIGLRSSIIETRGSVSMVVPNSKLVNNNIRNWAHFDDKVRFSIKVGAAYGSDTSLIKELLLAAVKDNKHVLDMPRPFVRFQNFGDSALEFELYFFSMEHITIEDIKSDIRLEVDRLFRENMIKIPFPQRELWTNKVDSTSQEKPLLN